MMVFFNISTVALLPPCGLVAYNMKKCREAIKKNLSSGRMSVLLLSTYWCLIAGDGDWCSSSTGDDPPSGACFKVNISRYSQIQLTTSARAGDGDTSRSVPIRWCRGLVVVGLILVTVIRAGLRSVCVSSTSGSTWRARRRLSGSTRGGASGDGGYFASRTSTQNLLHCSHHTVTVTCHLDGTEDFFDGYFGAFKRMQCFYLLI